MNGMSALSHMLLCTCTYGQGLFLEFARERGREFLVPKFKDKAEGGGGQDSDRSLGPKHFPAPYNLNPVGVLVIELYSIMTLCNLLSSYLSCITTLYKDWYTNF